MYEFIKNVYPQRIFDLPIRDPDLHWRPGKFFNSFFVKKNIVLTIIFYLKDAAPAPIFGIGESSGSPLDIIGSLLGFFNPFKLLNPLNLMGGLLGGGGLLGWF